MTNVAQPIGRIRLDNVRLAFSQQLVKPGTIPGADANAKPKWNCTLLLGPEHPQYEQLKKIQIAVAKDKWKDKAQAVYAALEKKDRLALHDGDGKPQYDGFPGNFYLSPSAEENKRPTFLDGQKNNLDEKGVARVLYAGCYVNASVEIWAQDNQWGQRINAQLRGIQFYKDGDAFGSGSAASDDEFEAVTDGADAGDFA